jgi:transposase-like protein
MPRSGPRAVRKYSDEFKLTAVRLSQQPGLLSTRSIQTCSGPLAWTNRIRSGSATSRISRSLAVGGISPSSWISTHGASSHGRWRGGARPCSAMSRIAIAGDETGIWPGPLVPSGDAYPLSSGYLDSRSISRGLIRARVAPTLKPSHRFPRDLRLRR